MVPNLVYLYTVNASIDDWDAAEWNTLPIAAAQAQGHLDSPSDTKSRHYDPESCCTRSRGLIRV